MPSPLLPLPHLSSFAVNSVDFLAICPLSLTLFSLWFFPSSARHRRLSSLWFFSSSAHHRRLSSLWFFPSSARHHRHPQDLALPLQISSLFLSSIVWLLLLAVHLLSLANEDVAAASLLSSSFLRWLTIAASLLSGSFLRQLNIAAILKIQHCRCRSPPSSSPPPSSHRFLLFSSDASSPPSTFSFSFFVDLCASSSSAFRHCHLPVFCPHPVHG